LAEREIQSLRRIYDALSRWDMDEFANDVTHDFEFVLPDTVPWGGTRHGRDGVSAFATIFRDHVEGQWADADDFIDAGDVIVVLGRLRGRVTRTGEEFETHFAHVWTLSDGMPSRCRSYFDTAPVMAALGLPNGRAPSGRRSPGQS
jgi:ketosteroid isomerase-like protein